MWTLDLAGFEPRNFNETGAALVHNTFPGDKHDFPMMIWPTNYRKLAASTMFTLFWAGKTLAPRLMVDRPPCMGTGEPVNIQDHLQISYLRCLFLVARAISEAGLQDSCVIGYDTFNEPNEGLLGVTDIAKQMKGQTMNGDSPTPFEAMCLGEGIACDVDEWKMGTFGPYRSGRKRIDPNGVRAWKPGKGCIWKQHGVWTTSAADKGNASGHGPQVLLPDYFNKNPITGETIDIERDFVQPFFYRVAAVVRSAHADAVIFIEPRVMAPPPEDWHERAVAEYGSKDTVARAAIFAGKDRDAAGSAKNPAIKMHLGDRRIAYTPHWYDGMTLVNKHFRPWFNVDVLSVLRAAEQGHTVPWYAIVRFGEYYVRHVFADNVMRLAQDGWHALKGNVPVVFGEFGLPYDMVSKIAYSSGDYQLHEQALDAYFNAVGTWWDRLTDSLLIGDSSHHRIRWSTPDWILHFGITVLRTPTSGGTTGTEKTFQSSRWTCTPITNQPTHLATGFLRSIAADELSMLFADPLRQPLQEPLSRPSLRCRRNATSSSSST